MPVVASHEVHHFAQVLAPEAVAQLEPELLCVEVAGGVRVAAVHDRVRDAHRDGFTLLDRPVLPHLDVGRDLDGPSVDVEEAETVAAASCLEGTRFTHELDAVGAEPLRQGINRCGALGTERNEVKTLLRGSAQADDVLLGRSLGGQVGEVVVAADLAQAPGLGVEPVLLVVVRDGEVDMPQMGDAELVEVVVHGLFLS